MVIGRFAEPGDVTASILFLLSSQSAMMAGATLPVEGGFLVT
jgi:L-xylulose reductase